MSKKPFHPAPYDLQNLIPLLKDRFDKHLERHSDVSWNEVEKILLSSPEKLKTLSRMEETGGEPDVIGRDEKTGAILYCDCSPESPAGRRSYCYDLEALNSRKEHKPTGNVIDVAAEIGIELLDEAQYRKLQSVGEFDLKTSSWIATPDAIRALGGALFGDRRYNQVFIYHNGAQSYYASRGFRGLLRLPT